jgi:FAD/FMN-containing dehydrogenase
MKPSDLFLDEDSLLVDVSGDVTLLALERELSRAGYTLSLETPAPDETVASWLAAGARGARSPWNDPADHLVSGFSARNVSTGEALEVRSAPRKSVGPDLLALVVGMRERFFTVSRATLRIFRKDSHLVHVPFVEPSCPEVTEEERTLLDRLQTELGRAG